MNQRSMSGARRVDTRWPQTDVMPRRAHRTADNPYRRKPRRSFDAFEVGGIVALAIGATLMVSIWMRWL